jgi:RHS repeat-associated protein
LNLGSVVGQYNPWDATFPVNVTDGQITVVFAADSWSALINAIQIVTADSVEVLPRNPALDAQQAMQFTANVLGTTSQAVTWALDPKIGDVSPSGLYTAPSSLAAPTNVTVTATSVENSNLTGSSLIALNPATANAFVPIRVNAGGPAYTDPQGLFWSASNGFSFVGSSGVPGSFSFTPPAGSNVPVIYQTGLVSGTPFQYQASVPNGQYLVTLKFDDSGYAYQDTFSVSINGASVLRRLNLGSVVGQYNPWDATFPVNVTDGQITIVFAADSWSALINAIQIAAAGEVELRPSSATIWQSQTLQFQANVANATNPNLTWSLIPPGVGSISPTGLYTAPTSITSQQIVTVQVTGVAAPSLSASATVYLWPPAGVTMSPQSASLSSGQTLQFTGVPKNGSPMGVVWSISPVGFGSISAAGLYTAPTTIFTPQVVNVIATSVADGSSGTAVIDLVTTPTVSVTPTTAILGPSQQLQLTASVSGVWNTDVNWSVNPPGSGSITPAGVYTAPSTIAAITPVTITAASVANLSATANAELTLSPAAASVTVAVTPPSVSLTDGQTQQFAATVSGTGNTAVAWSIVPSVGSISPNGLYTPPANILAPQTITVQAVSAAYPANFGAATIALSPPPTNNYSYRRPIVIDHAKVPNSDQTGFPVLISGAYSYLANIAHGGKVQNTGGFDIIFTSDCAGLQKLDHEIQSYDPATGTVAMWVLLPLVSHTVDTVFYLSYGDATVATSQENRASLDAARNPNVTHSADWTAAALNNQNSPATFYTIYPENANSIAPASPTLTSLQTQQFTALFTVSGAVNSAHALMPLGAVATPSPASSVAVNGNRAYVCDTNEVSVIDVSNPGSPVLFNAVSPDVLKGHDLNHCSIRQGSLVSFSSKPYGLPASSPSAFSSYSLANPDQPQLIATTPIARSSFKKPSYVGTTAFVPQGVYHYWGLDTGAGILLGDAEGDILAEDIGDPTNPQQVGLLFPDAMPGWGANLGYISGATLSSQGQLLYVAGSTAVDGLNGTGKLIVANVASPASMTVLNGSPNGLSIPGTTHLYPPLVYGNHAVALGDNGDVSSVFVIPPPPTTGNIVVTTFDLTDPQNPAILASLTTTYIPGSGGGSEQIGSNLFLFAGVRNASGHDVMLLVDTTNPMSPVLTPFPVLSPVTHMVAIDNLLHTTSTAGYAVYRIPGVTAGQSVLTGSCAQPVTWSLNPLSPGGITPSGGLYTAPASFVPQQTATVTAIGVADPTQSASAVVTLSNVMTTLLTAVTPAPYVVGGPATFLATVTNQSGGPVAGVNVTLTIAGVNAGTVTALTDANGQASLAYTGAVRGADTLQAVASATGSVPSATLPVFWLNPANPITTTAADAQFFAATSCASGCEPFDTTPAATPVFTQSFPNLMFDPPVGMLAIANDTRPFTDVVLDGSGAPTGVILAQGSTVQAGIGTLAGFSAVFRGNFVVAQAGTYTINIAGQDGWIFGAANGVVRNSGVLIPPSVTTTVFSQYPVLGANNGPSTGAPAPIVVTFPARGSYPYEFDYRSGTTGGPLSLAVTVTQGAGTAGLRPLYSVVLTGTGSTTPTQGQQATFQLQAKDETGAPLTALPVNVRVSGVNPQILPATTDNTGTATVTYTGGNSGVDFVQVTATVNGQAAYSNQLAITWIGASVPQLSVVGDKLLQLPNPGLYTATVTDPVAPAGGAITVQWTQLSGPGTVTFENATQPTTHATYTAPGTYYLQIAATDAIGSNSLSVGPITVQPPVNTAQGWIGLPLDGSHVSGQVPITVADGITLTSGTLTYYPAANPTAVVTLNADTTGSGQIGTLDTTLLNNGLYYVLLYATDNTGKTMGSGVWLNVIGDYKPGRVTTTVTDLVVPAPGMPIQISRTYDSLVRNTTSDFGYGWSLGIKVQLEIGNTNDITLTINNQRRTFYFTPTGTVLGIYTPGYTAEPGMFGKLTSPTSNCGDGITNQILKTGNIYICAIGYDLYQPQTLIYTDPYGRVYTIDGQGNLNTVKDVAGNTLTVTAGGITGPNGLSVPFVRDGQGRITQITDPLLNVYQYGYDAAGNLTSVTYPGVATPAQYTYDLTHLYTGGTDPRGKALPSTTYDTAGRLQTVTDAKNQTTSYAYTVATNTTAITYPDMGTATLVYDAYGKLLTSTDPLGHTTTNVYDANHNLTSVTDPMGHTTAYTYDNNGNRTSVTNPGLPASTTTYNAYSEPATTTDELGNVRTFTYDANFWPQLASDTLGPVVSFTFNANGTMASKAVGYDLTQTSGKATTYTYDQYGNLASETDALGRQTTYVYDNLGRKTSMTAPGGGATTYDYDALGHLKTVTAPLGRVTTYVYDNNGNKTSETDANNHTTTYEYDELNRLSKVTYPDTKTTQYTYDWRNNVIDTTDQALRTTHNVYDAAGRLTSVTTAYGTPDAATTTYTYYNDGRKQTETDPLNHTTTYNYDPAGRLTSTVDAQTHSTTYTYDDAGNQISVTDPNQHKTQQEYDSRRRLKKTTYHDSTTTQYTYDGPGNLASVTDQAGKVVQYTYDAANQLQSVVQTNHPDPAHNTTAYAYDEKGNLKNLTDANTHLTQNAFDALSQLKTETMPAGQTQTRNYDVAGNLTSLTDYNGHTTTYTYDTLNRLLTKVPDPTLSEPTVTFTYTPTGKRETMTDASGTTAYTYDNLDRLKTKSTPQGTLAYTYDPAGNVASMQSNNANGISVAYTYDNLNRLATVVDNRLPVGQNTTQYSYDPASNLATVTYPNGLSSNFTYDDLNRLKALNNYQYQLGPTGNRQSSTEPNGRTLNWSYDGIYRLTNETISLDPRTKNGAVDYDLDPVGNRLSQTSTLPGIDTGSATFDANDRLSTETYDNNGNTLTTGNRAFTYDFENRLKSMNGTAVTLQYDGDGNRVAKTIGGVTTSYLVDNLNPTGYAQVVEELVGTSVTRTYTYGHQRISQNQPINSTWTPSFYGYDGSGSVRTLTNATGTITDSYDYDAWGNAVNTTGSTPNTYLYRGEHYDTDLRLYYLRARHFNALTGRFVTRDTDPGRVAHPATLHKYLYTAANPVNLSDPSGHGPVDKVMLFMVGVGQITAYRLIPAFRGICETWAKLAKAAKVADLIDWGYGYLNPTGAPGAGDALSKLCEGMGY